MRVSVREAAELVGATEQFIRVALQRGQLPIGYAVKTSNQWSYFITTELIEKNLGIRCEK